MIGDIFIRKKFNVLALCEAKFKGRGECEHSVPSGRKSGVEEGWDEKVWCRYSVIAFC